MNMYIRTLILLLTLSLSIAVIYGQQARNTLEGTWEGPLVLGRDNMSMALTFSFDNEEYSATLTSAGLGLYGLPVTRTEVTGRRIVIRIPRLDLVFSGTMRNDEKEQIQRIDGEWFQHSEMVPVILKPVESPSF